EDQCAVDSFGGSGDVLNRCGCRRQGCAATICERRAVGVDDLVLLNLFGDELVAANRERSLRGQSRAGRIRERDEERHQTHPSRARIQAARECAAHDMSSLSHMRSSQSQNADVTVMLTADMLPGT